MVERGGAVYADPQSYERYNRLTEVIDSLDAAGVAELYRQLKPLLQEGYADLGYPDSGTSTTSWAAPSGISWRRRYRRGSRGSSPVSRATPIAIRGSRA